MFQNTTRNLTHAFGAIALAILACVALLATCAASAVAGPIATFTFGGVITTANNPSSIDPRWADVAVGNAWEISYTFDCMAPDVHAPTTLGVYQAISSYNFRIFTTPPLTQPSPGTDAGSVAPSSTSILVFDSQPAGVDQYEVSIPMQTGNWFMQLDDFTNTAFASDALPCCGDIPLPLAVRFNAARDFSLSGSSFPPNPHSGEIRGSIDYHTSVCVPEPASVGLLAMGVCGLGGVLLRRRRRGSQNTLRTRKGSERFSHK